MAHDIFIKNIFRIIDGESEESDQENGLIYTDERLMKPGERRIENVSNWFNKVINNNICCKSYF